MTPYDIRISIRKLGVRMRAFTSAPVHIRYTNTTFHGVQVTGVTGMVKNQLTTLGEEIQDLLESEVVSYEDHCAVIIVVGTTGSPALYLPPPPQDPPYPPPIWPPIPPTVPIAGDEDVWIV